MTGFGRGESTHPHCKLIVEIKSVNHRFKDVRFRMSPLFNSREMDIRKALDRDFKRGSFDVYSTYSKSDEHSSFPNLDQKRIKSYLSHLASLCNEEGVDFQVTVGDFLRPEFTRGPSTLKDSELHDLLDEALGQAIDNLKEFRLHEGQVLGDVLKQHQEEYERLLSFIEAEADQFEKWVKEKSSINFNNLKRIWKIKMGDFIKKLFII